MKKILLPTDFSDNSWNAIKYALQLYKNEKCSFILLNTYTPIIYQFEYMQASSSQLQVIEANKETSNRKLDELLEKIEREFPNTNHVFIQLSSFNLLVEEINELLKNNTIDLIIMGTKGASGLKEVLFGSNTVHVLNNAKCPVIAVPSHFNFETPYELLFPSDFEIEFKKNHIQPIIDIASLYNIRINVLHVNYGEALTLQQENNKNNLENYFNSIAHLFHNIKNQNIAEAITQFQLKVRVNLLVMINNKHSFFENLFFKSKIKQIGFHLNIPFLVIPSQL